MKAEEMWQKFCKDPAIPYEAWKFGDDPDKLAKLVVNGIKTATCSAYVFYELEGEKLPEAGEYSIVLDSKDEAVCIIQTIRVYIEAYKNISEEHAYKEGEGNRTLEDWRKIHERFFREELKSVHLEFSEDMKLVCEEFKVVYQ